MVPRMASTFMSGDNEKIKDYLKMSFRFVFFLAFPIMFGITSIAESFVPVFFGEGYDKVVILISIISPILLLMGMANVLGTQYLLPTKRQKEYTISVVIGLIVNFILNYILIKQYASIGASIATVISELVVVVIQYQYIKKDINFKTLLNLAWKYLVAGLTMFAVCFGVRLLLNANVINTTLLDFADNIQMSRTYFINTTAIICQMAAGALTYFVVLVLLKDDYIFKFIDKIKARLLKKQANNEK